MGGVAATVHGCIFGVECRCIAPRAVLDGSGPAELDATAAANWHSHIAYRG